MPLGVCHHASISTKEALNLLRGSLASRWRTMRLAEVWMCGPTAILEDNNLM